MVKLSEEERDALEQICNEGRVAVQRRLHLVFDVTSGSGCMDLRQQIRLRGEHHINALAHGAVHNGMSQMTFPSTAGPGD